jgi:hypothetical protein
LIKAVLKSVPGAESSGRTGPVDVRMAIGIGERAVQTGAIGTKSGSAYFHSGEAFENLRPMKQNLLIRSPWQDFDREMNLMFKFALIVMDNWSLNSGELIQLALEHPEWRQVEIGDYLGIEQNSVSGRFKRAYYAELMELDEIYRLKLNRYCDVGFDKINTGPPSG